MTYIDYLNAFNEWLETNALPGNAQLMYFKLLNVFNRAGWPEYVGVDNRRMEWMLDGAAKTTVIRARDKLIEAGFIKVVKGKKGAPSKYKLLKIGYRDATFSATENATENATESATENATHIKTKTKTKKESPYPLLDDSGFGPELMTAVRDWLAYKQERREGYKPTGLKSLLAQIKANANVYGETALADLIRDCMASGWRGIIFDRLKNARPAEIPPPRPKVTYHREMINGEEVDVADV